MTISQDARSIVIWSVCIFVTMAFVFAVSFTSATRTDVLKLKEDARIGEIARKEYIPRIKTMETLLQEHTDILRRIMDNNKEIRLENKAIRKSLEKK